MSDSPDIIDYVAFFEAEPTSISPEGWYYGATFESRRGDDRIRAFIAPDEGEFKFRWWERDQLRIDLDLRAVTAWSLDCKPGSEKLLLKFNNIPVPYFMLQLKPYVSVAWVTQWG